MKPTPILQAILVADHVYSDQATGKKIVAGIFNAIFLRKPQTNDDSESDPATPPLPVRIQDAPNQRAGSPTAYISLVGIRGPTPLTLQYVDLEDNSILFRAELKLSGASSFDPLKTVELAVNLPELPMPHGGHFALELLFEGELLGSHRIEVIEREE